MGFHDTYRPGAHTLVRVEVVPGHTGHGSKRRVSNWFVRVWYTGSPITDFRGEKADVTAYATEAEARAAAAAIEAGS